MRERFALLLDGFSSAAARGREPLPALKDRIGSLLNEFAERRDRADALEQSQTAEDRKTFSALLVDHNRIVEHYRLQQEQFADDFNLLDVLQLTRNEIRHSMVLAWLLDQDLRRLGTHAQGNLGFRLFLGELGLPRGYADCNYRVQREVAGEESIVDIEIARRDRFLIHIENKIWSGEGTNQTDREWSDLQRRAAELNVSAPDIYALFLTPHGCHSANRSFKPISWGRIVRVLEAFADQAKPPDVKLFARHYALALRRFIVTQDTSEDDNA